jgi:hypothetical protein
VATPIERTSRRLILVPLTRRDSLVTRQQRGINLIVGEFFPKV